MAAGSSGHSGGWCHYRHFLAGILPGFRHEKGQILLLFRGGIFCAILCPTLYKITSVIFHLAQLSHVNKFNVIKGSNLNRIQPLSTFRPTKLSWSTRFNDAKLTGISEHHKKNQCLISSPVHLRLTSHQSFYKIKISVEK